MKVLYIVSSLSRSGPIIVLQNIISSLEIPKTDIYIIKLLPDKSLRSITNEFIVDGVNVIDCNFTKLEIELLTNYCARDVAGKIRNIRPDIIHVHGYQAALVASKFNLSIPMTITLHNIPTEDFVYSKGKIMGKYMVWRFKHALKHFTGGVAISETVKQSHDRLIGQKIGIEVIYNGVTIPHIDQQKVNSLRCQYNIYPEDKVFISIGHLSALKDPLCIIKAFKEAFVDIKNVKLFFLGDGPLREECIKEIQDDPRIVLVGYTQDISSYLSLASFSISASHSEGFGLNVIESLVMGTPVIMSKIPVFDEFRNIYPVLKTLSFETGNSKKLAEILTKVYSLETQIKASFLEDAKSRFSSRQMGLKYLNYYKQIIRLF